MTKYTYETKENNLNDIAKYTFSECLKDLRDSEELTQKELAHKLGVPEKTYTNWEVGRTEPSIFEIFNILITTDATANDLFDINKFKKLVSNLKDQS